MTSATPGSIASCPPRIVHHVPSYAQHCRVLGFYMIDLLECAGEVGGFIDHFQEVARAHFTVRRLERRYGKDAVRVAYERFLETESPA